MTVEKCLDCGCDEGTLLKEFQEQPNKSWSWYELAEMTQVCVSCGAENIERKKSKNKRQARAASVKPQAGGRASSLGPQAAKFYL